MNQTAGIKFVSFLENSGYGIAARRYMRGLIGLGIPLTWTPMVAGNGWGLGYVPFEGAVSGVDGFDRYCNAEVPYDTVIVQTVPEYFPIWRKRERGKKLVGYTTWETDVIPRHWAGLLNSVDHLMVPCHWNREVMQRGGVTRPISVVPHVVPGKRERVSGFRHSGVRKNDFVFYSINTWTPRKALWKTVQAYLETFTADDPVVLVLKTSRQDFTRQVKWLPGRRYRGSKKSCDQLSGGYRKPARIVVIDHDLSGQEIIALHQRSDCYVSLCRSEGWGMGAFDACFHANPVIMTGYGGQLDYLSDSNSYLVRYELVPVEYHPGWSSYTEDQHWAEPDLADAGRWMRYVFENRAEAKSRGLESREQVMRNFPAENVCREMARLALGSGGRQLGKSVEPFQ